MTPQTAYTWHDLSMEEKDSKPTLSLMFFMREELNPWNAMNERMKCVKGGFFFTYEDYVLNCVLQKR